MDYLFFFKDSSYNSAVAFVRDQRIGQLCDSLEYHAFELIVCKVVLSSRESDGELNRFDSPVDPFLSKATSFRIA